MVKLPSVVALNPEVADAVVGAEENVTWEQKQKFYG